MTVVRDNLVLIILCGIPCSGKSTWTESMINRLYEHYGSAPVIVISRDEIRESLFDMSKYRYDNEREKLVTDRFYKQLSQAVTLKHAVIILDNTHVKPARINVYLQSFKSMIDNKTMKVYVKFFDIPLWKAKLRNIWRNFRTGKHIPNSVMNAMYSNYIKLDKSKYKDYAYDPERI